MCGHMYVGIYARMCTYMWKPEVDVKCHLLWLITLVFVPTLGITAWARLADQETPKLLFLILTLMDTSLPILFYSLTFSPPTCVLWESYFEMT